MGGRLASVRRFVTLVLRGSPVIQRATVLYVVLRMEVTAGFPFHHAGEAQSMAGRIVVIVRWWAM